MANTQMQAAAEAAHTRVGFAESTEDKERRQTPQQTYGFLRKSECLTHNQFLVYMMEEDPKRSTKMLVATDQEIT